MKKFNQARVNGGSNYDCLLRLDREVRSYVRRWLRLPGDTVMTAFYADVPAGGLGVLCLKDRVPLLKKQRMQRMANSTDPLIRLLVNQEPTASRLSNLNKRCKYRKAQYADKTELARLTRESYWNSCDGKGMKNPDNLIGSRPSVKQLVGPITSLSSAQYIGAIQTRLNVL